jgi:ATP-dependent protease ClpP protease subunit
MAKVRTDTNRDFWLTAPEAVDYGLVTRIVVRATELD